MENGTIIIINGTSSSGKTSIVRALQDLLEAPYLEAGIDKFIFMMPERYLDRPLWDDVLGLADHAGAAGHALVSGMHQAIAALSRAGVNVIADHVLVEPAWAQECARLFADLPAYLVGVQCPLDVLEQRERSRKNRTLGQAKAQYGVIHRYAAYDLEVDTSVLDPQECARQIQARLGQPPQAFQRMRQTTSSPAGKISPAV
jgi:chloramphenicol 3-O phosphotransferase